ncbi:MAG: flagellar basal body rod protein [uncultured bacterium]|nr:MAG: flagellar basal body rod protein [uncultured bacterium]
MSIGIYSALSGLKMKEQELDVVAHNMANVNTTGFKEQTMTFEAVMSKNNQDNEVTPFVQIGEENINFQNGSVFGTQNPLDLALQGEGFFEVQNEKGSFLTRNGAFVLNQNGELVNSTGAKVMGENGPIVIGVGSNVQIATSGAITVDGEDKGRIRVIKVSDPKKIHSAGSTLYRVDPDASIEKDETSQVFQGKLEQSNTNIMQSLVKLIDISRQYQSYQKFISNQNKLEQESVSSLGRIG